MFLADGRIADALPDPTVDAVVERLRRLEPVAARGEGGRP